MQRDLLEACAIGERMRRLPAEQVPPLSWEEFQEQIGTRDAMGAGAAVTVTITRGVPRWRYAALAAGIAVAVAGLAIWGRLSRGGFAESAAPVVAEAQVPFSTLPDRQALAQAEISERWLARLPVEPAVMRVGTRAAVTDLEDRIAWVDDVLSAERLDAVDPTHIVALQRERARLVNSLAQVRYAESLVAAAQ